jgi:tetratricopeptide (TPR) repeat protein
VRSARLSPRALASSLAALALLGAGVGQARDAVAEGRAHLRKANALAGNDRCEAAIKEYSLAYDRLHDPVVLFNRAECYRRIGEDASAAADYRAFLSAVPGAPNRAAIEAKIASVTASVTASVEAGAASGTAAPAAHASSAAPPPVGPANATRPNLTPPGLASPPAPSSSSEAAGSAAPLVVAPTAADTPPPASASAGHAGNVWIWAALGAAVAGGAVGAYLVLRTPGASAPTTELGNYRF